MMSDPLISIIMPCYNDEAYIGDAIRSVIAQTYQKWELIIVDDGSTDSSLTQINAFEDPRVVIIESEHLGVSAARNAGLAEMNGEYFCFLDSDDQFTPNSLEARIGVFNTDETLDAVDGKIQYYTEDFSSVLKASSPTFKGLVFPELVRHNPECFVGITWMIRRNKNLVYSFPSHLSHAEDLAFYLKLGPKTNYSYTEETIYSVRLRKGSAMSNLRGLEKGYEGVGELFGTDIYDENEAYKKVFLFTSRKIMLKSYLKKWKILGALRMIFRFL